VNRGFDTQRTGKARQRVKEKGRHGFGVSGSLATHKHMAGTGIVVPADDRAAVSGQRLQQQQQQQKVARQRYSVLSVYSLGEAFLRLRQPILGGLICGLLFILALVNEAIWLDPRDADARDMIYDVRVTRAGIQAHHYFFEVALTELQASMDYSESDAFEELYATGASWLLPEIVLAYGENEQCVKSVEVPCLSTSHEDRGADVGPLNVGTDVGQWAIGESKSLKRSGVGEQEVVDGVIYKYADASEFVAELPESRAGLTDPTGGTLSDSDANWATYASSNWETLQAMQCNRTFDLCEQARAAIPGALESVRGRARFMSVYDPDAVPSDRASGTPAFFAFRNANTTNHTLLLYAQASGLVSPTDVNAFAQGVVAQHGPLEGYYAPYQANVPVHLQSSVRVDGKTVNFGEVQYNKKGNEKKFGTDEDQIFWLHGNPCENTKFETWHVEGNSEVDLPRLVLDGSNTWAEHMTTISVLGKSVDVRVYDLTANFDDSKADVSRLTSVALYVSMNQLRGEDSAWVLTDVVPTFGKIASGVPMGANGTTLSASAGREVKVTLYDVSMPKSLRFPTLDGPKRVLYSFPVGGISFLVLFCVLPWLIFFAIQNYFINTERPPLFYEGRVEFRGW